RDLLEHEFSDERRVPGGAAGDEVNFLDAPHLSSRQRNAVERDRAVLQRDAAAEGVGNRPRLLVDLLQHEMAVAAFLRGDGVPGDLFDRPAESFSAAVED